MREDLKFTQEEFAQFVVDKIDRLEGRLKGFHFVINSVTNELRNSDPELALRISASLEKHAFQGTISDDTREIVAMYVGILSHGMLPPTSEQQ